MQNSTCSHVTLALLLFVCTSSGFSQVVNIPDANFKAALLANRSINTNGDDEIQLDEAHYFYGDINVSGKNIADLTGVAEFWNAFSVDCSNNQLTTLDVSHNFGADGSFAVYCQNNQLTSLQVSTYTYRVRCDNNRLTSLDLSKVSQYSLVEVYCQYNQLTDLRLPASYSGYFSRLQCDHNQLASLDVSKLFGLSELQVQNNQLTALDLSANTELTKLDCSANSLTSLNMKSIARPRIPSGSFNAINNPNLKCINVYDIIYAQATWANGVDAGVKFSIDCSGTIVATIADPNFKAALVKNLTINTNGDNEIQLAEAEVVETLNIPNQNIASTSGLSGIEQFVSLTSLNCSGNSLTWLDLTSNRQLTQLRCNDNLLTSLNVNRLAKLEQVRCNNNRLSSLTLSTNTSLTSLRCSDNSLTKLDVSANKILTELDCSSNRLTQLNLKNGNNTNFGLFDARQNPDLTCIQVDDYAFAVANWQNKIDATASFSTDCRPVNIPDSNFKAALLAMPSLNFNGDKEIEIVEAATFSGSIDVSGKNISSLTGIEAFIALTGLNFNSNSVTKIDLSKNIGLQTLSCTNNQLSELRLNLNPNLASVNCSNNILSLLYFGNGSKSHLKEIVCDNNHLGFIDFIGCVGLQTLKCSNNQFYSFTNLVSKVLETVEFDHNQVIFFVVPEGLVTLHCGYNKLSLLDVSKATTLRELDCRNNGLLSLNLKDGSNTQWTEFNATGNPNLACIKVDDVNFAETNWRSEVDASASFSTDCANPDAVYIPDVIFKTALIRDSQINTNGDGDIEFAEAAAVTGYLNLDAWGISDLTGIEAFTSLTSLNLEHNSLTTLDLSANTALRNLDCGLNQLTSLKVNTGIVNLICYYNPQLVTLDLSPYTNLESFICPGVPLNELDLRNNTKLTSVEIGNTNITKLDLSTNVNLTSVYIYENPKLTAINLKNGHNTSITDFYGYSNRAVTCVQVDDVTYAKAHFVGLPAAAFSTTCFGPSSFAAATPDTTATSDSETIIYPNPSTDRMTISGTQEITDVSAYNQSSGETTPVPFNSSNREADISQLRSATYLIKVSTPQSVNIFRIVKK